jgi:hypothetical protein
MTPGPVPRRNRRQERSVPERFLQLDGPRNGSIAGPRRVPVRRALHPEGHDNAALVLRDERRQLGVNRPCSSPALWRAAVVDRRIGQEQVDPRSAGCLRQEDPRVREAVGSSQTSPGGPLQVRMMHRAPDVPAIFLRLAASTDPHRSELHEVCALVNDFESVARLNRGTTEVVPTGGHRVSPNRELLQLRGQHVLLVRL